MRGLYVGDDAHTFEIAAELSRSVNTTFLDEPLSKVVVYLDPREFKSTWLGNKAIYRVEKTEAELVQLREEIERLKTQTTSSQRNLQE